MQPETDFTLHRVGPGFIREICQHDQKLTESEVLLLIVRVWMHSTLSFNMKPQLLNYFIGKKARYNIHVLLNEIGQIDFAVCKYKLNLLIIVVIKF